jgi:putative ABC transport system permease protein
MLWDVALRNLWQRRLRSALTILGVTVAVQLYLLIASVGSGYEQDLEGQLDALAGKVYVQQPAAEEIEAEDFPPVNSSIPAPVASELLALDGLDRASSSAAIFVSLSPSVLPGKPPAVLAVGIEPGHEAAFLSDFEAEAGQRTLSDPRSVILGQGAAEYYRPEGSGTPVGPGQTIEIADQSFAVVGVLEPAPLLFNGAVLMPLATAQDLFARSDTVSAVILSAASVKETQTLKAAVQAQFPTLRALGQDEVADSAQEMLTGTQTFFRGINNTIIAVVVVVIAIVMFVAVMEQRREIGTLRAIGARRRAILSLVVSESLTLCLIGAVLALPMWALVYLVFLSDLFTTVIFIVSTELILSNWVGMLVITLVAGVVASLWPAWQAIRVDPLEALRYE